MDKAEHLETYNLRILILKCRWKYLDQYFELSSSSPDDYSHSKRNLQTNFKKKIILIFILLYLKK